MSEMLKIVAKAAHDARIFIINSDEPDKVTYEDTSPRNHLLYERLARAVMDAMRYPTQAMIEAGNNEDDGGFCDQAGSRASALAHWRAMIDEALR